VNKCIWVIAGFFSLDVVRTPASTRFTLWLCCGGAPLMNPYPFGTSLLLLAACLHYVPCCVMNAISRFETRLHSN
jgi:hypothetical protein